MRPTRVDLLLVKTILNLYVKEYNYRQDYLLMAFINKKLGF